ncbi:disease resistance protein RGA2-like [Magnolia sinica]|uniref:disease resistance protein RGA2-like n=1 Tax=Magnolia sinica TaxID=86752 RepID=UPI0026586CBC|nr:disease resistance protein RGA2-like [Magnolia sinica]
MAEAFLSALVETMVENLNSLLLQQFQTARGVKKELGKLKSMLSTIYAVLRDADKQQVKSDALMDWLMKLKDVAYDADDLIDEFVTEVFWQKARTQSDTMNRVRNFFSFPNSLVFRLRMGSRIKEIGERLYEIAEQRKFHLSNRVVDLPFNIDERLQTDSLIESEVFGRDEDKKKIVESLIDFGTQEDVSIIPIVGMGGLGKTTLAQFAYNDERVTKHFELRVWVCVSDNFDVMRVIKLIIEATTGSKCDLEGMDSLRHGLQEKLSGKKFLLVLDDVWEENPEKWNSLKKSLRGARGSKIIVTIRSEKVASIIGTLPSHHLPTLSGDDCWSLFRQQAFGDGRQEHLNLVTLGKEIVKKREGVPLADVEKDDDGNIVWCKMDDLARFVAGTEHLIVQVENAESIHNISRHLSLECGYSRKVQTFPKALKKVNHLRTLLLLEGRSFNIPRDHFEHFMGLRVLDLSGSSVTKELLVSIGKLKHLRYLDLSDTDIKSLPESICTLPHLQTLRLLQCINLASYPVT